MIHTNEKVIKHKIGLLDLAEELGNVSKTCKMIGLFQDTFYRYKAAFIFYLILQDTKNQLAN